MERSDSRCDNRFDNDNRDKQGSKMEKANFLLALSLSFDNSYWPGGGMEDKLVVAQLGKLMWCQTVNVVIE